MQPNMTDSKHSGQLEILGLTANTVNNWRYHYSPNAYTSVASEIGLLSNSSGAMYCTTETKANSIELVMTAQRHVLEPSLSILVHMNSNQQQFVASYLKKLH